MSSSDSELDSSSHAAALKNLKNTDPEFYEFLKENDENLLEYRDSEGGEDDEDDEGKKESGGDDDEMESGCEPEEGENDLSDESEEDVRSSELESLRNELQNCPSIKTCKKVMSFLKKSFSRSNSKERNFVIRGELFNEIMKLCLVELVPALSKVLKLPDSAEIIDPSKSKQWRKLLTSVKSYLIDMLKIMSQINEPSTLELLLKHVLRLVPYYSQLVKLARILVKKMIDIWSTASENVRILAFVVTYRMLKRLPDEYHSQVLKQMYFAFVRNSKFTTPTSLPLISFMKRSLTELYACHPEMAYEHCFLYLRQLCIHLRNALTTKKKECFQAVYNWQFVHCIILWCEVITRLYDFDPIKTLAYPLIQLTIGTINLIPTLKYVPLRFHLVRGLIGVSMSTATFIPIPSIILEVLSLVDPNKKLTFTKKPLNLKIALKASKSQLQESGYLDSVLTETCILLTDYFTAYAGSISFPELAFFAIHQIKSFLKRNKVAKYGQQLKTVLDKLQQNSNFISKERNHVSFEITNLESVKQWEEDTLKKGTAMTIKAVKRTNDVQVEPARKKKKIH